MKKLFILFAFVAPMLAVEAQNQGPRQSPAASVSTEVGTTTVKVDYFRPKMKGRKIFGEGADFLVPYGKIWRTGANSGTKISFSGDVTVEGVKIPKGEYLIFTWPGAKEWTVSLYKDVSIGGYTDNYKKEQEIANFKVPAQKTAEKVEAFTVAITDLTDDSTSASVQLSWENTSVKFKIEVPKTW